MSKNDGATEELLLRVAWFYYKDELTQDEIAKRLSVSRASVGRMLDRARHRQPLGDLVLGQLVLVVEPGHPEEQFLAA